MNITFVSLQQRINSLYPNCVDSNVIIDYFKDKEWVAVDTETTGFDVFNKQLLSIQFGDKDKQFVVDLSTISIKLFKELLESKNLILQNAKFDLRFLYYHGIFPKSIYDTYLAEVKLTQGDKNVRRNLGALEKKYCSTNIVDKGNRGLIHRQGFSDTVIEYCAGDVTVLHEIREKQLIKAEELDLIGAIRLENEFCLSLAYTEFCGLYLNPTMWMEKVNKIKLLLIKSEQNLNNYILQNNFSKYIDQQLDLFSTERKVKINWNSDKQVKELFKELGISIITVEKGETKESIEATVLLPQVEKFTILPLYLEYKKYEKNISTYGETFLRHLNSVTKRIHTNFTQIVDTGRMASGGKQGDTETVNLQNIPADETRKCFTPQFDYNILINADYSGQEQIVLANKSKDKDLIAFYKQDLGDMHSYIASKIYPELNNVSLSDIKKNHKDKRQIAKGAGFAINYGGSGHTIAKNLGIGVDEGNKVEKAYFEAFPGLKNYFDSCEKNALDNGYILIDDIMGSKFFIENYEEFKELHQKYNFDNKEFWDKYREEKKLNSSWFISEKETLSYYFRWKGAIRRMSLNYPIQGTSATITKLAVVYFFRWIREQNLLNKVLIVNIVHDEIMLEVNNNMARICSDKLKECMELAGSHYCKIIPLKADPKIVSFWMH